MKKIFVVFCSILCLLSLVGCSKEVENRVSFRHNAYLTGSCENLSLTVTSGVRESPYVADGEKGTMMEFCLISLKPSASKDAVNTYSYEIEVDGEKLTGNFNKDVFGSTLSTDLGRDIGSKITAVKVIMGEEEWVVPVENMMSNALVTSEDALKKAEEEFSEAIAEEEKEGKFREIYIKFVTDGIGGENAYYWYVAFVGENRDYKAVLIDIVSGDIVAKRK
ncbi:MAG: hypothetical protein IJF76_01565 [Clostridia bacterium]|nr:hypothetical protein [Clostridia bacterium]